MVPCGRCRQGIRQQENRNLPECRPLVEHPGYRSPAEQCPRCGCRFQVTYSGCQVLEPASFFFMFPLRRRPNVFAIRALWRCDQRMRMAAGLIEEFGRRVRGARVAAIEPVKSFSYVSAGFHARRAGPPSWTRCTQLASISRQAYASHARRGIGRLKKPSNRWTRAN